jgi:hypothetical protein
MKRYTAHNADCDQPLLYESDGRVVRLIHDTCTAELSIDDNSNAVFRWKNLQGKGEVKLPYGTVYDFPEMLMILHLANGGKLFSECHINETVPTVTLFEKKKGRKA